MRSNASVITVDGPSGAGKGTLCGLLARALDWHLLDSGSLYRVTALAAQRNGTGLDDSARIAALAEQLPVSFGPDDTEGVRVFLADEDVSHLIRNEACGNAASKVAAMAAVRQALLHLQRNFRRFPGLVADGRDMGTVVFPDAEVKIFLTASSEERAFRRYKQLKGKEVSANLYSLRKKIAERDKRDAERQIAPLRAAVDAVVLDTTGLSIDDVKMRALAIVHQKAPEIV